MVNPVRHIYIAFVLLLQLPISLFAQLDFTSSNLPIIIIETNGQEIIDENRIIAHMGIINNNSGQDNQVSDPFNDYSGNINIEIRGSTSQSFPKKSYGFETQNDDSENRNVPLLGLPEENDWVLYAPYSDKSLVRNILSYKLSRDLGHYAPRTKLCELVLNGEYRGVYVLTEKIKRDKNRVDIAKLNADEISGDDLSGGYIIKIDKQTGDSGPSWRSELGDLYFQYEYPKHDDIVAEQKEYIKNYIGDFEQALISEDYTDLDNGYRKYINDSSFVDFFIVNELAKNIDGYILSTFLYKDKDSNKGKLNMGPIWDFNLAFGNANYRDGFLTTGFQVDVNANTLWWDRLLQDTSFKSDINNRWCAIREKQFSNESIVAVIDSLALILEAPQMRNFERWDVMGRIVWPNYYVSKSFSDEINYLTKWTLNRLHWLDDSLYCGNSIDNDPVNYKTKAYPNPFSDFLYYDFSLTRPGDVSLLLYDINGKHISSIVNDRYYQAGKHTIDWNSSELAGSVYILILSLDGEIVSRKRLVKL